MSQPYRWSQYQLDRKRWERNRKVVYLSFFAAACALYLLLLVNF